MDLGLLISCLAILILLVLSGFFSGSETALTAASRARMHQLAQDGDSRAKVVNALRENKERLIGAILLGNNLVNILATALTTAVLTTLVGEAAVPIATVVMTLLVLIFSEVLPKTYAIHHADAMARTIAPVLRWVVLALSPIVQGVTAIVRLLLRMVGADTSQITVSDYVDELRGAIELHRGPEREVAVERAMLRSILELGDVEVAEVMTHRRNIFAVDMEEEPAEIIRTVVDGPFTRVPLFAGDADNVVGVLHAKALLRATRTHDKPLSTEDLLSIAAQPWFIPDTTTLIDQLQAFRTRREHFAVVIDEYGSLQGVVTLEDILEEIVGEITDEHDIPVAGVRPLPNGSYIVDGTVTLRDLNRRFEWRLPDQYATTVAGLVLHEAQRIPAEGQVFTFFGFRFEILRRQRNQITSLRITPPEPGLDEEIDP